MAFQAIHNYLSELSAHCRESDLFALTPRRPSLLRAQFCFQFNRAGTHKTLDKDLAASLLSLCLAGGDRVAPVRRDSFAAFLTDSRDPSHARVTLDQWRSFLQFALEYPDDASLKAGYDEEESAWPVLIDEYVDHLLGQGGGR